MGITVLGYLPTLLRSFAPALAEQKAVSGQWRRLNV
jgi:hypothetical protein